MRELRRDVVVHFSNYCDKFHIEISEEITFTKEQYKIIKKYFKNLIRSK